MQLALLIEYDGREFAGWQAQPNVRTVQGELEKAFRTITGRETLVIGAGRTDAGVHATGMVAHCVVPDNKLDIYKLVEGLNATSGNDVVVKDIRHVPDDFHARFSAVSRRYRYSILNNRTALYRQTTWTVYGKLDLNKMNEAGSLLCGKHDFTSFSKRSDDVEHYECDVLQSQWFLDRNRLEYVIRANRFVRGMVRSLVGALVEIGKGKMTMTEFESLLKIPQSADRAIFISPPEGLILEHVEYDKKFGLW